jgi:hypothetical protein
MATPFATYLFGGMGVLFLVRGLWNPHRALVHKASLAACPGPTPQGCQDTIDLSSTPGARVYSVGSGKVIGVGDNWVLIQVSNEPVLIGYYGLDPSVAVDQHVGRGRRIGKTSSAGRLSFGVTEVTSDGLVPVEPRSWLAARGFTLTVKKMPATTEWCGPSRHVTVPQSVHRGCALKNPEEAGFALLPVSVKQA